MNAGERPLKPGEPGIRRSRHRRRLRAHATPGADPAGVQVSRAAPSSASGDPKAQLAHVTTRCPPDGVEQQFLRAFEAWRDLERRERLLLRVGRPVREEIAFTQIAMRCGFVGRSRPEGPRGTRASRRRRRLGFSARRPSREWADASNGSSATTRSRARVVSATSPPARQASQFSRGLHIRVVDRQQRLVFLHRPRPVVELSASSAMSSVRALVADRRRNEHGGALRAARYAAASPAFASASPSASCAM